MALIKRRNKYYARIRWYLTNGKQEEIQIPLKTSSLTTARTRLEKVRNQEENIKDGIVQKFQFKDIFRWLNPEGLSRFTSLKLGDIIPEYLKYRHCVVRKTTAERDGRAIKLLTEYLGKTKAVAEITYKDIEQGFIPYLKEKGCTDSGCNITLRHAKILFSYLLKEKLIPEPIKFRMVKEGKLLPRYFNRKEIDAIYDAVDEFWKRCFSFYEETGCRPKEPFMGEIEGNWLRIPPEETKGKNWRMIQLTDELKYILMEMRDFRDTYLDGGLEYARYRAYDRINRKLNRTIKQLGFTGKSLSLKSFRHTYGIIRVHLTGDIFQVSREMGHTQVTTTQRYLDFPQDMILDDFPELGVNNSNLRVKGIPQQVNSLSPLMGGVLANKGHDLRDTRGWMKAKS